MMFFLQRVFWGTIFAGLVATGTCSADDAVKLRPFLESHCMSCHDADTQKGGLDLTTEADWSKPDAMARWVRVYDRLARGEMPPGKRKPEADEKSAFLAELGQGLTKVHAAEKGTVLRRLNRLEYENTLHDLLDIRVPLADLLPGDRKSHGFDTVGAALDLSSAQLQKYLDAADIALTAATQKSPRPQSVTRTCRFDDGRNEQNLGKYWLKRDDESVVFFQGRFPSIIPDTLRIPIAGRYRLRLKGYAYQSSDPITFSLYLRHRFRDNNSRLHGYYAFKPGQPQVIEILAEMNAENTIHIIPELTTAPGQLAKADLAKFPEPGLALFAVAVEGPLIDEWPKRGHKLLWGDLPISIPKAAPKTKMNLGTIESKNPKADAENLLKIFVPAAFRRPVPAERIRPYIQLAYAELDSGATFEQSMRSAYKAVLCSPYFLYLIEPQGKLDDYAIASRLSYFLWRSAPDAELLAAAERGELTMPDGLRKQTERLLRDPKSQRFVHDFLGLWLNLRDIEFTIPDEKLYPDFDNALLHAMIGETEGFFTKILQENRPLTDFLHSDWTMLNERLAKHYGIAGVKGPEFHEVKLPVNSHRGGLITQASVLKVSANGTTTSPVTRGAWVLERLLGEPPPPPPPGVPGVEPDIRGATTIREQLDKHRNIATCAACHKVIDPPGFALEAYDVIGGWRERYRAVFTPGSKAETMRVGNRQVALGPKVDASGMLADGRKFSGPDEFKKLLMAEPDRFAKALTEKLATFATGREMGFSDRPAIAAIVNANAGAQRGFRALIHQLVQSELFLTK
ncbi:MAG: DUF1592 domain-containing protein [Gemmataceae bacterium]